MYRAIIATILLLASSFINAQSRNESQLTVVYYNLDGMYDTQNDSYSWDDDYTPDGHNEWDADKYEAKTGSVAENLISIGDGNLPGVIILSGIEKEQVVTDILATRRLRRAGYAVHYFNKRPGIAFLVRDNLFDITDTKQINNDLMPDDTSTVASVIYLKAIPKEGKPWHFFINCWPGREGGIGVSEPLRLGYAASLRKQVDMILNFEPDAKILITGTFNDEPTNRSLISLLNATNKQKNLGTRDLYNLYFDKHNFEGKGTILVNSVWQMFDFFIVSPAFLKDTDDYYLGFGDGMIYGEGNEQMAIPTYRGGQYLGGTSGHLPVYVTLKKGKR